MSYFGIHFNGKHSYNDLGLRVVEKTIGNPAKIKRKERIPFSNKLYDFSGIYGGQEYEERSLQYVFSVKDYDKIDLSIKKIEVLNWLMQPFEQIKLLDDYIPGYYFLAEVEDDIDFDEMKFRGRITVDFTAYPFKIGELYEGNDIWDTFNFLLDYAQVTEFEVSGNKEIVLYNPGTNVIQPEIEASASMEVKKDNTTYNIPSGKSKSHDFMLQHGENKLTIKGNGTISFQFRKELI